MPGGWVITRQTSLSRFSRAVKKIAQWRRCHRHLLVAEQHVKLSQKLRGHDAYYGITGNSRMLQRIVDPERLALVSTVVPESVDRFGQHALSRDGLRYAFLGRKKTGARYGLDIVDTQKLETLASMPLSIDSFYGVRFLSDQHRVVVATPDMLVGVNYARRQSAVIWPNPTEKQPAKKPAPPSGDDASVAGTGANDLGFGPERRTPFAGICAIDVSPHDVVAVAAVGGNVLLIDLTTGETLHQYSVPDQAIVLVKFSDDGNHLTVAQ